MNVKKPIASPTAEYLTFVEVTPQILREYADRLEQAGKNVQMGQTVKVNLCQEIAFVYSPDTKKLDYNEIVGDDKGTVQ